MLKYLLLLFLSIHLFADVYIVKFGDFNEKNINLYSESYKLKKHFSSSNDVLLKLKQKGEKLSKQSLPDLRTYFEGDLNDESFKKLKKDKLIEIIYKKPQIIKLPFDIAPETPDYISYQGYLYSNESYGGTNSTYAWDFQGGAGENVTVTDIEYDWILNHEDLEFTDAVLYDENGKNLTGTPIIRQQYPDYQAEHHGTSVLGEIAGKDNNYGVTGMAHKSSIKVVSSYTSEYGYSVGDAIIRAVSGLDEGSVILLEAQTVRDGGADGEYIPVEYSQAEFDAIKTATSNNIIVVEAGGNGNQNMDDTTKFGNVFNINVRDSGAIIVGAANPPSGNYGEARGRMYYSSYGSRFDVQAWGFEIYSTGYGDVFNPNDEKQTYTAQFGGTSGASPIITATVAQIQGRYKAKNNGNILTPLQMREILKNPLYSYPQTGNTSEHIGPFPNIELIFRNYFNDGGNPCDNINCNSWETCVNGECVLKEGNCVSSADCSENDICNPQTHICETPVDPCDGITCSDKGYCSVVESNAVCICVEGYHSNGLTCIENNVTNPCDGISCSNHGACKNNENIVYCECDEGYHAEGLNCVINSINPCDGITCSDKGYCSVVESNAVCICVEGYHSNGLTCIENNVTNPCDGVTCSGMGVCTVTNNLPYCQCKDGYEASALNCIPSNNTKNSSSGCSTTNSATNENNLYLLFLAFFLIIGVKLYKKSEK